MTRPLSATDKAAREEARRIAKMNLAIARRQEKRAADLRSLFGGDVLALYSTASMHGSEVVLSVRDADGNVKTTVDTTTFAKATP